MVNQELASPSGITEVAGSLDLGGTTRSLAFNIAQFTTVGDLVDAFHRVRDISLSGKVPLVFFDEFDCNFENRKFGWLKYLLAPMQDGLFMENGVLHPIGKSIFVFAGGTCHTFDEFSGQSSHDGGASDLGRQEKLADFISRLRGYINIIGPNPVGHGDTTTIVRRAVMLRSLISRKYPELMNRDGVADIGPGVLRAFLRAPKYKHGVRSMEALLEMSRLTGERHFGRSALPTQDQMDMHIDSNEFLRLLDD